jgi:hypothetical protein
VSSPESVIDINVSQVCQHFGKILVVLLFLRIKAHILQEDYIPALHLLNSGPGDFTHSFVHLLHRPVQQFRQACSYGVHFIFFVYFALWAPEV